MNNKDYYRLYKKYKSKYLSLKNKMIGGGLGIKSFNYDDIEDISCDKICKFNNDKINEIKLGDYRVISTSNKISLYNDTALYTKFSSDNFKLYFGYLKEMVQILNDLINYNRENGINKKYSILILGFGLGGACLNFSNYDEFYKIDSIDMDYNLFKLFKKITKLENINVSDKINYLHGNAIEYLQNCIDSKMKYDIILDDIFISSEKVNYNFNMVYDCLEEDGIFFMNVHYDPLKYVNILKKNNYKHVGYKSNNEYLIYAKK